jgi:predicted GNAT family acetyltransferase
MDFKIDNNALASRFELAVNGGLAVLDYRIDGDTVFLLHVEVPLAEQGRGIAGKLSHAALEFARDNGLKVVPWCPFIATYIRRHPELLQPVP